MRKRYVSSSSSWIIILLSVRIKSKIIKNESKTQINTEAKLSIICYLQRKMFSLILYYLFKKKQSKLCSKIIPN